MTEEWRPVVGFEGYYEVSTEGRVRSLTRQYTNAAGVTLTRIGRILKPCKGRVYPYVDLRAEGRGKAKAVHTLVAEAFLGPRPDGMHICHNNGDATDNRLANLRHDTPSANERDKYRHGRTLKTHCLRGHPYTPENTYFKRNGTRYCRACRLVKPRPDALDEARAQAGRAVHELVADAIKQYGREIPSE